MRGISAIAACVLGLAAGSASCAGIDLSLGCKGNPQLVGACFAVRGRLRAYNGSPTFRIKPFGSVRLLGVVPSEDPRVLPAEIRPDAKFGTDIYGNFTVCPVTRSKPGVMQFVCVESVEGVRLRKGD